MEPSSFPLTRAAALVRLDEFVAHAAPHYGARRNYVDANGAHETVSRLSAALRRRLISEEEVLRAVLAAHPFSTVEKFVAEVFWRTYWKGWLELHRGLWPLVQKEILLAHEGLKRDPAMTARYDAAIHGTTGIAAFDHWSAELQRTGYLHNWARMQVASIWIFTLGLPWQLGADWMYAHLLDADPASNTLSWRWVAGLHTKGKSYLASAERIAAMTGGALAAQGLVTSAHIPLPRSAPQPTSLRDPITPDGAAPCLLLLTCEDLSLETQLGLQDVRCIVIARDLARNDGDRTSLNDAARRAAQHWPGARCEEIYLSNLPVIARAHGCSQIVTGFVTAGPVADGLDAIRPALAASDITLAEHLRRWDQLAWPHCGKCFFQLKSRIPALLRQQEMLAA